MLRVGDGDEECFGVLLDRHRNSLVHFLFRMVQEQPVAEELAQEVFLRIYRSRAGYEATARFTTWMFRIATHVALNWLRDERHQRSQERLDDDRLGGTTGRELSDPGLSVEQRMLYEARLQEVRDAIATLPERQRAAVLMHKYQEMEYSQIANVLEISELAVKSLLFRAYQTLRARLAYMVTGDPR
jgi:RNA polymerase sigma-70 factor (ECF subfamily)